MVKTIKIQIKQENKKTVSALNCMKIEKAANGEVKAEDILPDFPWETLK